MLHILYYIISIHNVHTFIIYTYIQLYEKHCWEDYDLLNNKLNKISQGIAKSWHKAVFIAGYNHNSKST